MAYRHGWATYLGYGIESTPGTPVASTNYLEIDSQSLTLKKDIAVKPALRGLSVGRTMKTLKTVEGAFAFKVNSTGQERLFRAALGALTTTGAGPYVHTIEPANALPSALTITVNRDSDNSNDCARFAGCYINKLTLTQGQEELLLCELDVMGMDRTLVAEETPSFPSGALWDYSGFNGLSLNSGGATYVIKDFSVEIDNSLAAQHALGYRTPRGFAKTAHRKVSGSFTVWFDESDYTSAYRPHYQWENEATTDLSFQFGTTNPKLVISVPKAFMSVSDPEISEPGPQEVKVSWTALRNAADNDEIDIVFTNSTASP